MLIFRSFLRDADLTPPAGGTVPPVVPPVVDPPPASELSNADVKNHPLFQKVAGQLADVNKGNADREAAEAVVKAAAEEKRLKDAGLFDEAAASHKATIEKMEAKHASELLNRDLETELYKATFTNDKFVKGSIADYNPETGGTIAEYVAALVADEANKPFLATANGVVVPLAPGKVKVEGAGATNWEEVKVWEKSKVRTERIKARELISAHKKATGEYPYKLE